MYRIESLLSARLFISPQSAGGRIFFISNLSGRLSLYVMDEGGSVPEPLLPPDLALHNPHLVGGYPFAVFPQLGKLIVMVDRDGDEVYQPKAIPMEGGFPEETFGGQLAKYRLHMTDYDRQQGLLYFYAEARDDARVDTLRANLITGQVDCLASSPYGLGVDATSPDHRKATLIEGYETGDNVLYLWEEGAPELKLLFGVPMDRRQPGQKPPLNAIFSTHFIPETNDLLMVTALFSDTLSLGRMSLDRPGEINPLPVTGVQHTGAGEMEFVKHLDASRYLVGYNIEGASWVYLAVYDRENQEMALQRLLIGAGELSGGVLESLNHDKASGKLSFSFSTARTPTQIYTLEGANYETLRCHTREKVLGIPSALMAEGEDASYTSFDGTHVSARLYLPAAGLGYKAPYPVVFYIHGGPQGQERPDFAWFSMPLIQYLTLNGLAVFVPNVRGSTGYGLSYTKQVDRDWGGQDRLDHVHAFKVLEKDARLDIQRAGVVGRSYGGYMTLTLAARHPELWSAAVDMFGPYDLVTFLERVPPTWKPYMDIVLGNPEDENDRKFLLERSPRTYINQVACPMLVIQGAHDPRVVAGESKDLVEGMQRAGKLVEFLLFENEGHDVLKFENRVTCYNAITDFFVNHLGVEVSGVEVNP